MNPEGTNLRVRINQIDYTMIQPGPLDNSSLPRVPVIRIYGESSLGQKACVHVHQVYPYFFIEYTRKMDPISGESARSCMRSSLMSIRDVVNQYIVNLIQSLNLAISVSLKRNPSSPNSQFIRAITLVKGIHFYGFHASYSPFLKIHIADPAVFNRAVTIMHSGTIMKTRFRIYESHLSFVLQFMSDFGLYGCGWIDLAEVWQRGNDAAGNNEYDTATQVERTHQGLENDFKISPYFRQSRMTLEVDVAAHQILNRHLLTARNIHHELVIPEPALSPEPLVPSVRELWEDERRRRIARGLSPSPEIPKDLSERSRGAGGDWVSEARYWEEIRRRIEKEKGDERPQESGEEWERWVMTTFESVEALWEPEYKTWKPAPKNNDAVNQPSTEKDNEENPFNRVSGNNNQEKSGSGVVEVDEALLASQAMHQLVELEEAAWEKAVNGDSAEVEDDRREEDDAVEGPPPDYQADEQDYDLNQQHGEGEGARLDFYLHKSK